MREPSPVAGDIGAGRTGHFLIVSAVIAAAAGAAAALRAAPSPDVSWLLLVAGRVLDGAAYGTDVLEVNPPLVVWLYLLPAAVARFVPLPAHTLLAGLTVLLTVCAAGIGFRLLRAVPRGGLVAGAVGLGCAVLPGVDVAQREHLAAILCLPFFAAAAARCAGATPSTLLRVVAGSSGALGLLIKPHFGLAWLLVEVFVARRLGPRALVRTENLCVVAATALYVTAVFLIAPGYLDLAARLGPLYSRYLAQGQLEAVLLIAGAGIFVAYRAKRGWDPVLGVFELASLGFLLGAAIQLKWWPYHFLPGVIYALPPLLADAARWRNVRAIHGIARATAVGTAVLLLAGGTVRSARLVLWPERPEHFADPTTPWIRDWLAEHAAGDTVMVLSSNIHSAFPAVPLAGAEWGSRMPSLWPLLAVYYDAAHPEAPIEPRPPGARTGVETWLSDIVLDDLQRYRPRYLVVLDHDPLSRDAGGAAKLDYLSYFAADPRFAAVLATYKPVAELPRHHVLEREEQP